MCTDIYKVCPRKDHRGVDLISDALPFGRLWYGEPDDAIDYAKFFSRSRDAVIGVYDVAGNVIATHEQGRFQKVGRGSLVIGFSGLLSETRGVTGVSDMVESRPKTTYAVILLWLLCGVSLLFSPTQAQSADSDAIPEMAQLAKVLTGDWNTVEIIQHGKPVAEGEGRRGTVHVTLAGGGTVLVSEGHSAGTVGGDLRWFITIWWDPDAKSYRFLTCFKTPGEAGCELRGTAHWEGDTFVNDYDGVVNGKHAKM